MKFMLFLSFLMVFEVKAAELSVKISDMGNRSGNLLVAVFNDPGQFPNKKPVLTMKVPVLRGQDSVDLKLDLPFGDYAISTFLDENNNERLDVNILRIPRERFGFSNNPQALRAPTYQECEFRFDEGQAGTDINLRKIL